MTDEIRGLQKGVHVAKSIVPLTEAKNVSSAPSNQNFQESQDDEPILRNDRAVQINAMIASTKSKQEEYRAAAKKEGMTDEWVENSEYYVSLQYRIASLTLEYNSLN